MRSNLQLTYKLWGVSIGRAPYLFVFVETLSLLLQLLSYRLFVYGAEYLVDKLRRQVHSLGTRLGSQKQLVVAVVLHNGHPSVNEALSEVVENCASEFFTKHGYYHDNDADIFDMRFELKNFCLEENSAGDTIAGVTYRWAQKSDLEKICACMNDALEEFSEYYRSEHLYLGEPNNRVLLAEANGEVAGALMVDYSENSGIGTIGCMGVKHSYRGRRIATRLAVLATKYLRDQGMREAFLGYTYSGLDRMYGVAGYKICVYYMMAKKELK